MVDHINQCYGSPSYIDAVIITHGDDDHSSGFRKVIEAFGVNAIYMNRPWLCAAEIVDTFKDVRWSGAGLQKRLRDDFPILAEFEDMAERGASRFTRVLVWIGVEFPALRFLWLAIMFYFGPVILFDWPDTPKTRAERRYFEADAAAKTQADAQLIEFMADRLVVSKERVAEAYPDAERTIARRKERSDRYRRRNAELKRWLSRS